MTVSVDATLREAVYERVLGDASVVGGPGDRTRLRAAVARALAAEGVVVEPTRWAQLVRDLVDDLGGLGPLESLLRDPEVTDVMVNGPADVWVDRAGRLEPTPVAFEDDDHVVGVLRRALGPLGVRLDRTHPWADAVLPGGVRVHALLPPVAPHPTVTLRRVPAVVPSWEELVASGSVAEDVAPHLIDLVRRRANVVVCGRAGVGKTTLLARMLAEVGEDRTILIEDAPELTAPERHVITLRVRPPNADGAGGVDLEELVRNALRMRPDRIVVGEVRGREVAYVLQAMNTGHDGSMTTVHANGAADALVRLEGMALLAGVPMTAARAQLATAVDAVVAMGRDDRGGRRVEQIIEVAPGRDGPRTTPRWQVAT